MRSPVAISNGWAPVLASYSAITLFTSSMSAVAGSYSRSVVSPWDEKVRILAFMLGLLRDVDLRSSVEQQSAGCGPSNSYMYMAPFLGRYLFLNFPGLIRCFLGFCRPNRVQNFRFQNGQLY